MKTTPKQFFFLLLIVIGMITMTTSCTKETDKALVLPVVTTLATVTNITGNVASCGGTVTDDKGQIVTARGVCWSTDNPSTKDSLSVDGKGVGTYTSKLQNLLPNTTYFVRAYATNSVGTAYGDAVSFTTLKLPTLRIGLATDVRANAATIGVEVVDNGGLSSYQCGICYSTSGTPTVANTKTYASETSGVFSVVLTNLIPQTTYWARAFSISSEGTAYGNDVNFTTKELGSTSISSALIPAGTFTMGSPTTEVSRRSEETQHLVTLSAFRMSKYEITNTQYAAFLNDKNIGSNGLYAAGAYPLQTLIYNDSYGLFYSNSLWSPLAGYETSPVINVTWYGAAEFATYVGGTLPTEAQWEYACRAGTTTPFSTGNYLTNLQANYNWANPYNGGINSVTVISK